MKPTDGVKIFIKNQTLNKYVFILRDDKPDIPEPNTWELPGGAIESGETPLDALKRELKEELNINIDKIKPLHSQKKIHNVQGKKYEVNGHYYTGQTDKDDLENIKLTEGQKIKYFSIQEISKLKNVSPTIKELINKYNLN